MIFKDYAYEAHGGFNVTSQNGEDRIIRAIFDHLTPINHFCIEFGAADGLFCSNTYHYWADKNWDALLMESDADLFEKLRVITDPYPGVNIRHTEVSNVDHWTVDEADILSIDVDGEDFDIWFNTQTRHRVVVVEHNPTYPPHLLYHGGRWQGASARSLERLGKDKDYTLAAITKTNMIFVRNEDANFLDDYDTSLINNFDWQGVSYIVSDYHGNFDVAGTPPYGMVHREKIGFYHE